VRTSRPTTPTSIKRTPVSSRLASSTSHTNNNNNNSAPAAAPAPANSSRSLSAQRATAASIAARKQQPNTELVSPSAKQQQQQQPRYNGRSASPSLTGRSNATAAATPGAAGESRSSSPAVISRAGTPTITRKGRASIGHLGALIGHHAPVAHAHNEQPLREHRAVTPTTAASGAGAGGASSGASTPGQLPPWDFSVKVKSLTPNEEILLRERTNAELGIVEEHIPIGSAHLVLETVHKDKDEHEGFHFFNGHDPKSNALYSDFDAAVERAAHAHAAEHHAAHHPSHSHSHTSSSAASGSFIPVPAQIHSSSTLLRPTGNSRATTPNGSGEQQRQRSSSGSRSGATTPTSVSRPSSRSTTPRRSSGYGQFAARSPVPASASVVDGDTRSVSSIGAGSASASASGRPSARLSQNSRAGGTKNAAEVAAASSSLRPYNLLADDGVHLGSFRAQGADKLTDADLRSLEKQMKLLRLLLKNKLAAEDAQQEESILQAWNVVYSAEQLARSLAAQDFDIEEISKVHQQIVDMVRASSFVVYSYNLLCASLFCIVF
jgi:hypothetical protein